MTQQEIGYAVFTVSSIVLFALTLKIVRSGRKVKVSDSAILLFILVGLIYDNFMLGFGSQFFQEGTTFLVMSVPRYLMHGLFTPLLIVQVALSCYRLNVPGYRSRGVLTMWGATAFIAIFIGLVADVGLELGFTTIGGVWSYKPISELGPPLAEIITVVSMIAMGIQLTRFVRWPWVLVASSVMFYIAAFYNSNGVLANLGEQILLSGCVATGAYAVKAATKEREAKRLEAISRKRGSKVADSQTEELVPSES